MDFTKDKARTDVMAGKAKGVFELDVAAKVLNPRRAKSEKYMFAAIQ